MPLLKVNQIASYSGNTLTVGTTGDTVTLATGASSSGFGFDGVVWTSNIVTSALTVSANVGYFVNTSTAAITVTLPASASNGDQIIFTDYNRKWGTNALTLNQNSLKFQGYTSPNPVYNTDGQTIQLVYADSTQGWIPISDDDVTNETPQSYSIDFLVVGGGGSGGSGENGNGENKPTSFAGFERHVQTMQREYCRRASVASAAAERHLRGLATWRRPTAGMFLWASLSDDLAPVADAARARARAAGVVVVPGAYAHCSGDRARPCACFRLSFAGASDEALEEGVKRLGQALQETREEMTRTMVK